MEDERFKKVSEEQSVALNEMNNQYNNMINQSDQFYEAQKQAAQDYGAKQTEIQQANTDFAIEQINQAKEQAQKDYLKEQKGAYSDWQKQSNQYGVNAEQMAAQGLRNTGYSESSQVSMYNTYQNRVSTAKESYNRAVLNYDNGIKEAQLQNNAKLAEIAYQALQTQLSLSLEGFQYKNTLLQQQMAQKQNIEDRYYSRWQDIINQINEENKLKEEQRQFNAKLAEDRRQFNIAQANKKASSGGNVSFTEGSFSNTTAPTSNNMVKAIMSPNLSTGKASSYWAQLSKQVQTEDDLVRLAQQAYKEGKITDKDVDKILKVYGY